jgi:murein DD-endopeptidase MepM/ murein hydrolase activator NlpD
MAHGVPMAAGDPAPAWPLVHPERAITGDFAECRPFRDPRCPRHHAAEDLPAPQGTIVIAPEGGVLVEVRDTFHEGTGVMLLQTDGGGPVIGLGEVEPGSWREFAVDEGARVLKGQAVARVGRLDMLHFETYRSGTRTTSPWERGARPPASLLDPTDYLERAAGWPVRPPAGPPPPPPRTPTRPPARPSIFTPPAPAIAGAGAGGLLVAVGALLLLSSGKGRR